MIVTRSPLALIDWHDATIATIATIATWKHDGGATRIVFAAISVYRAIASDRYEVFTCSAYLELTGCLSNTTVNDVVGEVDDLTLTVLGAEPTAEQLLRGTTGGRLDLSMQSGESHQLAFSAIRFFITSELEHLEFWNGPLISHP